MLFCLYLFIKRSYNKTDPSASKSKKHQESIRFYKSKFLSVSYILNGLQLECSKTAFCYSPFEYLSDLQIFKRYYEVHTYKNNAIAWMALFLHKDCVPQSGFQGTSRPLYIQHKGHMYVVIILQIFHLYTHLGLLRRGISLRNVDYSKTIESQHASLLF